jgi:hypothetical protein
VAPQRLTASQTGRFCGNRPHKSYPEPRCSKRRVRKQRVTECRTAVGTAGLADALRAPRVPSPAGFRGEEVFPLLGYRPRRPYAQTSRVSMAFDLAS